VIDRRTPKDTISREELLETSERLLATEPLELVERFEILPVSALGLEWEIATHVVEPASGRIAVGADGRKVGAFILHGGMGDHREKLSMARFLASRFGYRVSLMSYPGRFYLPDPEGRWPGDTIEADGTLRIPIWHREQSIDDDQYEVVTDRSDPVKRAKWGTLTFAAAKPGTEYHDRLAAWPAAFEEGMKAVCARDFPDGEFSVYVHGHSTGGPFAHMILQRIPNVAGLIGAETSSFSHIFRAGIGIEWTHPFNYLAIMGWRNIAMYRGAEAGPDLQWRLPLVMEDVLDEWAASRHEPYFKAEYIFTYAALPQLEAAARSAAKRLSLGTKAEEELVERFKGYTHELSGPDVRPVPPLLLTIVKGSRDHTPERYRQIVLPMLAAMRPAPKVHLLQIGAGVHGYDSAEPGLPMGAFPAIAQAWDDAIRGGFYLDER
jgi:hypothetical protein